VGSAEVTVELENYHATLSSLHKRWLIFLTICAAFLTAGFLLLKAVWTPGYAIRWLLFSGVVIAYQIWLLRKNLSHNHRIGEDTIFPGLGLGNIITLFRGVLFASLTGFLFAPRPTGGLVWIPAVLYTVGALIDFLDGYAARLTNRVTKLGEILDMSMDGWGMLVASFLAVQYGQVPGWYILVGLARYLYLFGLWLWNRLGRKIYDLPPNITRRPFAGLQMGFAFVMLWPIFTPPGTHLSAIVFSLPFLIGFTWDWLIVSGMVKLGSFSTWPQVKPILVRWLPLGLRIGALTLIAWQYLNSWSGSGTLLAIFRPQVPLGMVLLALDLIICASMLFGAAGRVMAVAGLIGLGIRQIYTPLSPIQIGLIWVFGGLMYFGTGVLSAWKPEDWLIYHRAGE
jgi:CDP-diacylglycerol---glycerol-3-phosphate 3-phosphatidyltransferase